VECLQVLREADNIRRIQAALMDFESMLMDEEQAE
jgi:hypothetical protein